jgi:hypothetical protein
MQACVPIHESELLLTSRGVLALSYCSMVDMEDLGGLVEAWLLEVLRLVLILSECRSITFLSSSA